MTNGLSALMVALGILVSGPARPAQGSPDRPSEPFKLGTFRLEGRDFVGAVIRDTTVIDLVSANDELQCRPGWIKLPMAAEMKELIGRYTMGGLRQRIYRIVGEVSSAIAAGHELHYVYSLGALKTLPPIRNPENMLNAAVNYQEHADEMAPRTPAGRSTEEAMGPGPVPGIWERKPGDRRHNPYLFQKPRTAIIGDGDAIRMPPGRERLDWECELAVVIGRHASRVSADEANEYIFGLTIENDVSDRGGRGDGRHGSDWLIGKGHDTFAPLGPFIVPRELIGDPMNLAMKFTLNGEVMQDSNTSKMIHDVYELVSYASRILTLQPGDVISTGSPSGVGVARNPPVFMKKGDIAVSWIEGIGTLTNPVK
ncbi:MAG: fumarylacetoacetate hydrolase family protein [Acidobacteriota bacterium]